MISIIKFGHHKKHIFSRNVYKNLIIFCNL